MDIIGKVLKLFGNSGRTNNLTFEEQLQTFLSLGFALNSGIESFHLDMWEGQYDFEEEPFSLMYMTLGQTTHEEPWTPLTDRCWDFDTEAIEDHDSYIHIVENLGRISRGEMKFENIQDYVDIEEKKAWVSFSINGDNYWWDLQVDDDWVHSDLFSKIVAMTEKYNTIGRYTYFDTGGQNAVLGFETPEELEKIKAATGLNIEWLK